MDAQERVNAAFTEMQRYSVAVSVQLERIEEQKAALKAGREERKEAGLAAVFNPNIPTASLEDHLRSLKHMYETGPWMHLKSEIEALVSAIWGIHSMAMVIKRAVTDDKAKVRCMQAALTDFDRDGIDVLLLRNLIEHMDGVLEEKGNAYGKLPNPEMGGVLALPDDDVGLAIGGKAWSIRKLSTAAKNLVRDVTSCVQG